MKFTPVMGLPVLQGSLQNSRLCRWIEAVNKLRLDRIVVNFSSPALGVDFGI